jgi:nitroreductase
MKDVLHFLHTRNSAPKLSEPGPSALDLDQILGAAMRAPDHARLRPWRFITVQGQRREALGRLFLASLLRRSPDADQAARDKALAAPLRAPTVMVVVCRLSEHPKVPHYEQRLSAGCAAHGALLAAEALGLAGIWRTGDVAFDRAFMTELGLADNEEIVGFLYLGTRLGSPKPLPKLDPGEFNQHW